jgi:hypothetical protein
MGGREVTVQKKSATALVQAGDDPGSFEILLSTSARDRDNEVVSAKDWEQPLPGSIPLNSDHNPSVHAVVGSGQPFLDGDGNLRVVGKFASTPEGQHLRTLVNEGHVQSVSVEFIRNAAKGVNTLVGGAFVTVPANPEARVLASKSAWFGDLVAKAAAGEDVSAMIRAIHDAAVHLDSAVCPGYADPDNDGDNDLDPGDDPDMDGVTGARDGANSKAYALKLRLRALAR